MSRKNMCIISRLALMMVFGLVLTIASCKKSPQESPKTPAETTPKAEKEAPKPAAQPDINAAPQQPAAVQPSAAQPAAGMEPIPIVLPKPVFIGTPERVQGITNLEKPLGKAREPFYAPKGTANVASKKPITSSDEQPIIGELSMITDGDKEAADGSYVELGPSKQHITIDLGAPFNIYAVLVWHYHKQARVYKDVIVQVADDADFITNVRTIFNNDDDNTLGLGAGTNMNYVETAEGKLIDAKGVVARYVRCYSNGNSANDLNNYIEVEVYGTPVK